MSSTTVSGSTDATATASVPLARCLIGGAWVEGSGAPVQIYNPATGETVTEVRYADSAQVSAAVAAAKAAQPAWSAVPLARRVKLLHKAAAAIAVEYEEISRWITLEMGKTIHEAKEEFEALVLPGIPTAAEDALRFTGKTIPSASPANPERRIITRHEPIGVGAFISPWNFPVEMILNIASAVVVGNTTVWKPSEFAPYAPGRVAEVFASFFPAGVVNLVYGEGDVGEQLVTHPDVGFVSFIGSTAVGERIASAAGVKRLQLELRGNGPLVVLDDADLDAAVEAAVVGCFFQAGQVCTASERILVQNGVRDEFAARLAERASHLRLGNPIDPETEMGPLINERILAKTIDHVRDATEKGATILAGGSHRGLFHDPTVLVNVTPDMAIAREETFGPVAPIIGFDTLDEAISIANDSPYGLQVAVFSSTLTNAWRAAEDIEAGVVVVNASNHEWDINGPFGGVKKSGYGRELGEDGLRCYTNVKQISFHLI